MSLYIQQTKTRRSVQRYSTLPRFDLAVTVLTHAVLRPCPYSLSLVICLFPLSWISPIQQTMISMFLHQRSLFTLNAGWHHCSTEDWGWQSVAYARTRSVDCIQTCVQRSGIRNVWLSSLAKLLNIVLGEVLKKYQLCNDMYAVSNKDEIKISDMFNGCTVGLYRIKFCKEF